jgi:hypothetical protein
MLFPKRQTRFVKANRLKGESRSSLIVVRACTIALQPGMVYGGAVIIVRSINCGERRDATIAHSSRKGMKLRVQMLGLSAWLLYLSDWQVFPNGRKITIYVSRVRSDHLGFYY